MRKEIQQIDELDSLLERMTLPTGFPDAVLRGVLRTVLERAPNPTTVEVLNSLMVERLKTMGAATFKSNPELENGLLCSICDAFRAHKDEPYTVRSFIRAKSEEESEAKAKELAGRLRKLLPANIWIFVGPPVDGFPAINITQGKELSKVIGFDREEGDVLVLIHDDGNEEAWPLMDEESWEDCVKRVNPNNDKPLRLCGSEPSSDREHQRLIETKPKLGRNDPCPCGSGKKWKKCCMGAK